MNFFIVKLLSVSLLINIVSGTIQFYDDKHNHTVEIIESISAAFGPRIDSDEGFKGYIVVANPLGGCTTLEKPPNVSWVDPDEWIVLIKRTPTIFGNCSFDWKVNNAQLAGYKAVIIYNSESDNLIKMSSSGKYRIRIPSVFISRSDGLLIERSFTYMNHTYAVINNDDDNLGYLLIPFICVVAVCFIIAVSIFVSKFIFHLYKLRKNRFPKSALKKIPTKKYSKTDKYDTCPICLNEYEEGEKMRILPCQHAYHIECIDKWLLRNNRVCPVCKRRVLPGGSDSESDDGHEPQTPNVRRAEMNAPNEDEDTNEASSLLVNVVRTSSNEDNISASTISTILNNNNNSNNTTVTTTNEINTTNAQQFGDMSSMNNQMTASSTSSQTQNPNSKGPSSRYGSISSSLNIVTATTSKLSETEGEYERPSILKPMEDIDSKQTPEFHSPIEISGSVTKPFESITASTQNSDLPQVVFSEQQQPASKKNSKKSKKTSNSQQNEAAAQHEQSIDSELKSCTDSGENLVETSEKKALIQTSRDSAARSSAKSKKSKKKSSSQATSSSSKSTDQQNNNNGDN